MSIEIEKIFLFSDKLRIITKETTDYQTNVLKSYLLVFKKYKIWSPYKIVSSVAKEMKQKEEKGEERKCSARELMKRLGFKDEDMDNDYRGKVYQKWYSLTCRKKEERELRLKIFTIYLETDYEPEEQKDEIFRFDFANALFKGENHRNPDESCYWLGDVNTIEIEFSDETDEKTTNSILFRISRQIENLEKNQRFSLEVPQQPQPWNVPFHSNPNFIGRREEMERLHQLLLQEKQTFITHVKGISGMGGIGKTQLAVEYAYKYREVYPGGVLWVKCDQKIISSFGSLVFPLHLDVPFDIENEIRCQCIKYYLQEINESSLLILDGLDNKDDFKRIRGLFPTIGNCHILITSRLKQFSRNRIELDVFSDDESLKFFYAISDRAGENEEAAIGICEILGNLPLAIEVAGKYLDMMAPAFLSLEDYLLKLKGAGAIGHRSLIKDEELEYTHHTRNLLATLKVNHEISNDQNIKRLLTSIVAFPTNEIISPWLLAKIFKFDFDDEKEIFWENLITLDDYSIIKFLDNDDFTIHSLLKEALEKQLPENEVEERKQLYSNYITNQKEATVVFGKWFCNFWLNDDNSQKAYKMTSPAISQVIEATQFAIKKNMWPLSFDLCMALGKYFMFNGCYQDALFWLEKNETLVIKLEPYNQEKLFLVSFYIGEILCILGKYEKALTYTEKALEICKAIFNEKNPYIGSVLGSLGKIWNYLGDQQMSLSYQLQALEKTQKVFGERHLKVAMVLHEIALSLEYQGEHQKAILFLEQAISILKEVYGEKHDIVTATLNTLGLSWLSLKNYEKAIQFFNQAFEINKELHSEKHRHAAVPLCNLAYAWSLLGEHQKAISYYEKALNILKESLGKSHPDIAMLLLDTAKTWVKLGNKVKAREHCLESYNICMELFGKHHLKTQRAKEFLNEMSEGI